MKKFPDIPKRVDEDYYSIEDDTPLVSIYTTRNVLVRGILIPDEFFTKEIHVIDDFKEYEMVLVRVDVPMNQQELVGNKRKQTAGESSSPRKSQKITIMKKKQSSIPIPPPDDDDVVEKVDKGVKEKSNADVATGSMEFRKGKIRTQIKNKFITHDFFMGKIREVLDHCNKVMPELIFAKTNEMINKEMPRLVNLAVNKD
ncbi:hypothetical protein Tco_1051847, partial [Tanacetum coccineum]